MPLTELAISFQSESVQASVLEIFLCAIALSLRENTEHQVDLTVERGKFSGDLHDDIFLEFLTVE